MSLKYSEGAKTFLMFLLCIGIAAVAAIWNMLVSSTRESNNAYTHQVFMTSTPQPFHKCVRITETVTDDNLLSRLKYYNEPICLIKSKAGGWVIYSTLRVMNDEDKSPDIQLN